MADSFVSRRISEVTGVALFAATLLCLISLVSYSSHDPVWFFKTLSSDVPQNFAGRVGALVSEAAFQLLGYSAYLIPILLGFLAWHYFWCTKIQAGYTKLFGIAMLFGSVAACWIWSSPFDTSALHFQTGGVVGKAIATLCAAFLNRTGARFCR